MKKRAVSSTTKSRPTSKKPGGRIKNSVDAQKVSPPPKKV